MINRHIPFQKIDKIGTIPASNTFRYDIDTINFLAVPSAPVARKDSRFSINLAIRSQNRIIIYSLYPDIHCVSALQIRGIMPRRLHIIHLI